MGRSISPVFSPTSAEVGSISLDDDRAISPQLVEKLIDDAFQRIGARRRIVNSNRTRRFLQFIVREVLAGRADRIKTCAIALIAFERDAGFVPVSDPVVRIEASRLRRSLEHCRPTEGSAGRNQEDAIHEVTEILRLYPGLGNGCTRDRSVEHRSGHHC
jgi:hypothetical protein